LAKKTNFELGKEGISLRKEELRRQAEKLRPKENAVQVSR